MKHRNGRRHYTTYLAGPMQAVSYSGAGWRVFFTELLKRYNVLVQDPVKSESKKIGISATRAKAVLRRLAALAIWGDEDAERKFMRMLRLIVSHDFRMVHRCDFIIAQVIEGVVSIGTTSEIIEAARCKIPVYVIYSGRPEFFPHWLLYYVFRSGGRIFVEKKRNGFKRCLNYLRNRFELEELERNGH